MKNYFRVLLSRIPKFTYYANTRNFSFQLSNSAFDVLSMLQFFFQEKNDNSCNLHTKTILSPTCAKNTEFIFLVRFFAILPSRSTLNIGSYSAFGLSSLLFTISFFFRKKKWRRGTLNLISVCHQCTYVFP